MNAVDSFALGEFWGVFVRAETQSLGAFVQWLLHPRLGDAVYATLLIVLGLYSLEFLLPWRRQQLKRRKEIGLDVFYTAFQYVLFSPVLGEAVGAVVAGLFGALMMAALGIHSLSVVELDALPLWCRWILLFLVTDLLSYWIHWLTHRVGFLWEFHKIHHSARELDVWNAQRGHVLENFVYRFLIYLPMQMIGFQVQETFFMQLLKVSFCNFSHSNVDLGLGPLKFIFNNPQMHVWHHAVSLPGRLSANYGSALSVWDYLFGTAYVPEDGRDLEIGVEGIDEIPPTFIGQQVYPFRALWERVARRVEWLAP